MQVEWKNKLCLIAACCASLVIWRVEQFCVVGDVIMNQFERLMALKKEFETLIEDIEGAEIQYKGDYGTVMFVHLDGDVTVYLENAEGEPREEVLTWAELAKNAK